MVCWSIVGFVCMVAFVGFYIMVHDATKNAAALYGAADICAVIAAASFCGLGHLTGRGKSMDAATELRSGDVVRLICVSELPDGMESSFVDVVTELPTKVNMYLRVNFSSEQKEMLKKTRRVPLVDGFLYRHYGYGIFETLPLRKQAMKATLSDADIS